MFLELIILGFVAGIIAALFGVGGGILITPLLVLIFSLHIHNAIGTALCITAVAGLCSTLQYHFCKKINYKAVLYICLLGFFGAIVGTLTTELFRKTENLLGIIFGIGLLFIATMMFVSKQYSSEKIKNYNILWLCFFSGYISGLIGVGGGILNVPILYYAGISMHTVIGTACVGVFTNSLTAALIHITLGNVLWEYVIFMLPMLAMGTYIGGKICIALNPFILKKLFAIFLFVISIFVIIKYI